MTDFTSKKFYAHMDGNRHARGISWAAVARDAGVSPSVFTYLKAGVRIHVDTLVRLAEYFELYDLKPYVKRTRSGTSGT